MLTEVEFKQNMLSYSLVACWFLQRLEKFKQVGLIDHILLDEKSILKGGIYAYPGYAKSITVITAIIQIKSQICSLFDVLTIVVLATSPIQSKTGINLTRGGE